MGSSMPSTAWQLGSRMCSVHTCTCGQVVPGIGLSCVCSASQLLNKQHLAGALDVAEMRDGLVVFESAEDADRFASKLEEEGHSQVRQLRCSTPKPAV